MNVEPDEESTDAGPRAARATWLPLEPAEHRQRTIWSLACTAVLLTALTFSLTSVVFAFAPF
jgi:hypothetical protein